jgi:hypothetical protein
MKGFYGELAERFATIEKNTGLEVCIYPSEASSNISHRDNLSYVRIH